MTFEKIIDDIDSLPPLSSAAHLVQSMYASGLENINIARLVRVIESDAILTANILKMINAPLYGFIKKIVSISQAVSLFGVRKIHMLVMQYAMTESLRADTSVYGFANTQFNELCHLQSALMLQWYSKINLQDAQFLAYLSLIMESGKLVLAKEVVKSDYYGEFRKAFNECKDIQEFEKDLIGVTSYTLSAVLFEHWNLEPQYIEILKALDSNDALYLDSLSTQTKSYINKIDIIRTAINVKEILTDHSIHKASQKVVNLGMSRDTFEKIAYSVRDAYFKEK